METDSFTTQGTKMNIELSEERQQSSIVLMMNMMETLNDELPALAGKGDLKTALELLKWQLAQANLHIQRTFVLVDAIESYLAAQGSTTGFRKSGENFSGTVTPIN